MIGLACINRYVVTPRLAPGAKALAVLRATSLTEVALGTSRSPSSALSRFSIRRDGAGAEMAKAASDRGRATEPSPLLVSRPEGLRPAGSRLLPAARDCERVGLDVLGDDRTRADIGAVADRHRGDEGRVGADEGAGADVGLGLGEAVVIAGDRARADVGVGADAGVADVAQVIDLGARFDRRRS